MRRLFSKLSIVLIYFLFIAYLAGFQVGLLLDIRGITAVVCGMVLLSVPVMITERSKESTLEAFCKNAVMAGYIATFLFLFSRLNNAKGYDNLLADIALNCRPLLYGMILYIFLKPEEKTEDTQTEQDSPKDVEEEESKQQGSILAEQIYYLFRAKGLTQREAEVARLAYNRLSNREIAEQLFISETTVKKHLSHIFEKLDITSREALEDVIK